MTPCKTCPHPAKCKKAKRCLGAHKKTAKAKTKKRTRYV